MSTEHDPDLDPDTGSTEAPAVQIDHVDSVEVTPETEPDNTEPE